MSEEGPSEEFLNERNRLFRGAKTPDIKKDLVEERLGPGRIDPDDEEYKSSQTRGRVQTPAQRLNAAAIRNARMAREQTS